MPFRDRPLKKFNSIIRSGVSQSVTSPIFLFLLLFSTAVYAADKGWIGSGDGTSWSDSQNWFSAGVPTSADNAIIDLKDASVISSTTYEAKSISVGGAYTSAWTSNNFIYGTISPSATSDDAIYIRKNGTVTLKGAGTITLKGKFKNSEEEAPAGEEAFMFTLE